MSNTISINKVQSEQDDPETHLELFKTNFMGLFTPLEIRKFPGLLYMPLGNFLKLPSGVTGKEHYDRIMSEGYNLFLDDVRQPHAVARFDHNTPTLIARTSRQAEAIVEKFGCPKHIYLDFYLDEAPGNAGDTSMKFLDLFAGLLADECITIPEGFTYSSHSADNEMRARVCNYMKSVLETMA